MQEKNLSLSGDVSAATAVQAGKLLGVEYILVGDVTEFGEQENKAQVGWGIGVDVRKKKFIAALDVRLISVTTSEILWAETGRKEESNAKVYVAGIGGGVDDDRMFDKVLRPVVEELSGKLMQVPMETSKSVVGRVAGKIAKIDGGRSTSISAPSRGSRPATRSACTRWARRSRTRHRRGPRRRRDKLGTLKVTAVRVPSTRRAAWWTARGSRWGTSSSSMAQALTGGLLGPPDGGEACEAS